MVSNRKKTVAKKVTAKKAVTVSSRAKPLSHSIKAKAASSPFKGRAFAYTYEQATGQVLNRGDSICRDKHPFEVRAEFLANNPGKSVVLLAWHEISLKDYGALLKILNVEAKE